MMQGGGVGAAAGVMRGWSLLTFGVFQLRSKNGWWGTVDVHARFVSRGCLPPVKRFYIQGGQPQPVDKLCAVELGNLQLDREQANQCMHR